MSLLHVINEFACLDTNNVVIIKNAIDCPNKNKTSSFLKRLFSGSKSVTA